MKTQIYFIIILFFTTKTYSQEIECYGKMNFDNFDNLYVVINDYAKYNKSNMSITIVDYYNEKEIDCFRLKCVFNALGVLNKVPSCYLIIDSIRIIYLYTDNYKHIKDTIWVNDVINKTYLTLKKNNPELNIDININWRNETIFLNSFVVLQALEHDPYIIEYEVLNGKILNKIFCDEMYYPDIILSDKILKEYKNSLSIEFGEYKKK